MPSSCSTKCSTQFQWTSLVRAHVLKGHFTHALLLYALMHRRGIPATAFTLSSALTACARLPALVPGTQVHAKAMRTGCLRNKFVQTALLDMYAKCGLVAEARRVFDGAVDRDVVAWTAMIRCYAKIGAMGEARRLFDAMGDRNDVSLGTMVAGYAGAGEMEEARGMYEAMKEKSSVASVAMIAGHGKRGDVAAARSVFVGLGVGGRDSACWAAMVACYAQNGHVKDAIDVFEKMRAGGVAAGAVAVVGAISACTQLGDFGVAAVLAELVDHGGCERTAYVSNALIHMHSRCGNIEAALREFARTRDKDVVSYTTLIVALADHGDAARALELFSKMQREKIIPNEVTFVGVLSACSHAGLVEEACRYFNIMTQVFRITPKNEHYACMVDLLGRAGLVEKAFALVRESGNVADAKTWGSLLASCRVHGHVEISEIAASHLFKMEPRETGHYVVLASIYAETRKWDEAERLRKVINEKGLRKSPGRSWISTC